MNLIVPNLVVHAAESEKVPICGLLKKSVGNIQILDENRIPIFQSTPRTVLPCGSWVSVNQGWAQIEHSEGVEIGRAHV